MIRSSYLRTFADRDRSDFRSPLVQQIVHRPRARSLRGDVEKEPAEEEGNLAAVHVRPEAVRGVSDEVGERHQSAAEEGGASREEANGDEDAAHELDGPRAPDQRLRNSGRDPAEDVEEFLRAVAGEEGAGEEAEGAGNSRG